MRSFWKPLPHKVARLKKAKRDDAAEQRMRTKVRQEDRYRCRVCRRGTKVVHEHPPRSRGTEVSLRSSFCACDVLDGGLCHVLLQRHLIVPVMADGSDEFNAREDLVFEMTEAIALLAFEHRPRPAHVRIVKESP